MNSDLASCVKMKNSQQAVKLGLIEMTLLLFIFQVFVPFFGGGGGGGHGVMRQLIPKLPVLHSNAARLSKSSPRF